MEELFTFQFPDIGEGVVEGEVIEWLKQEGDSVAKDEPVVTVMTDKATVEIPSPHPGKLHKVHVAKGAVAKVGEPLFAIALEGGRPLATPKTRHLAKELSVSLEKVTPTGKEGRITEGDVHGFATPNVTPLTGIPKLMARKMTESHQTIPTFSFVEQVEATRLVQLHHKVKQQAQEEGVSATYTPFLVRALSLALMKYPLVNSAYDAQREAVVAHEGHHIGVAFSTPQGLIVPVLKDVQDLSLEEIIRHFDALKQRARENALVPEEMRGGTITISNFGPLSPNGLFATPIINPPEAAILAVSRIHKVPLVVNDEVVAREVLYLSWSFDHRLIDGDLAARFSHTFAELLSNPAALL